MSLTFCLVPESVPFIYLKDISIGEYPIQKKSLTTLKHGGTLRAAYAEHAAVGGVFCGEN